MAGVLPLFHVPGRLLGSRLVSTPAGVYGGVLAEDLDAGRALVAEAKRLARQLDVGHLELREPSESAALAGDAELRPRRGPCT
jgi:hypothetical protein